MEKGNKLNNKRNFFSKNTLLLVLVVVLAGVFVSLLFLLRGPEYYVKSYAKGFLRGNPKLIVKYMHDDCLKEYDEHSEKSYIDYLNDEFSMWKENNYKIKSYEILGAKKLDKKEREDVASILNSYYEIEKDLVKEVNVYNIEFKVLVNGEEDKTRTDISTVKLDDKWYVFPGNLVKKNG